MDNENQNNFIRQKIKAILDKEPDVKVEEKEAERIYPGSPHQQYLRNLMESGKSIEEIQTLWHQYYLGLNEQEKSKVWAEFYESNTNLKFSNTKVKPLEITELKNQIPGRNKFKENSGPKFSNKISRRITSNGRLGIKQQLQSLLFGLGFGALVLFIFMFGFFNEYFITPFIQPSSSSKNIPLIIGSNDFAATATNQVIIPKINLEIPTDFSLTTTDESQIENDLENGVVHYPTTVNPGEIGNAAFFGHSSNNILNPGKYKFAFVLLHELTIGDTFYLTYNQKIYVYKVINREVVDPSNVSVLDAVPGQTATATLITCDPPGTSLHRLVVVGQQISPNPSTNVASSVPQNTSNTVSTLPGNGPSLFTRFISTSYGKPVLALLSAIFIFYILRVLVKFFRSI